MNIQPASSSCTATTRTLSRAEKPVVRNAFRKSLRRVANTWNDKFRKISTYLSTKNGLSAPTEKDLLTDNLDNKKAEKRPAQPDSSIGFSHLSISHKKISLKPELVSFSSQEHPEESGKVFLAEDRALNPVAIFGFDENIFELRFFIKGGVNAMQPVLTMPALNRGIGLIDTSYYNERNMANACFSLMKSLMARLDNDKEVNCSFHPFLTPDFLHDWKSYLKENKEKLDVFIRLSRESDAVKKEGKLKELIIKNTDFNTDAEQLHAFIKENLFSCTNVNEVIKKLEEMKLDKKWNEMGVLLRSLYNFIDKHFFRNTSKLGLAFLQGKGFDFMFAERSQPDEEVLSAEELARKKYKQYERNSIIREGVNIETWEPITFSEARFINKNLPLFKDAFIRVRCDEKTIRMAKWGDDNWLEHPRAAFTELKMYARK